MIETTGDEYQSSDFAKALFVSEAKIGKSCYLIGSALGVLPWQKHGGVVDDPANLHVLTFDTNALGGVKRFLLETCGAPAEALKFRVYNMEQDMLRVSTSDSDWDSTFFNSIMTTIQKIQDRARGSAVLHISSLTGAVAALQRAVSGPPGVKKGGGMDMAKWDQFGQQINEFRSYGQAGNWHCFWEAHVYKPPETGQNGDAKPETLQMPGKSGANFPINVAQVFRIRRSFGEMAPGTKCNVTYLDTRPAMAFIAGGRSFTEALEPKEYDMTLAFKKLGLKVGGWGAKAKPAAKVVAAAK